ncbi:hypothetical protein [Paenibacillus sp. UMB7766-LJ446]|uniref:hypothetical protein n=1 Tax=Paenibacillus sp. UMB7766-LJ446 TaxID=3046313 RepID=UPI00254E088E|nr:hypothetical protein [Paenibacillus sp. UMB7766-LJ446]
MFFSIAMPIRLLMEENLIERLDMVVDVVRDVGPRRRYIGSYIRIVSIVEQLLKHRKMIQNGYEKYKSLIPTWSQSFSFSPFCG